MKETRVIIEAWNTYPIGPFRRLRVLIRHVVTVLLVRMNAPAVLELGTSGNAAAASTVSDTLFRSGSFAARSSHLFESQVLLQSRKHAFSTDTRLA